MPRLLSTVLFVAIALSIVALSHYYLWTRLVNDLRLPPSAHRALTFAMAFLFLTVPGALLLGRRLESAPAKAVTTVAFVWMGVLFILLTCVGAMDVMRLIGAAIHRVVGDAAEPDPSRRTFVARLLAGLILFLGGGASIAALRSGLGRVMVREIRVPLSRLPAHLDGTTIVQLSDVHVGPTIGLDFVREIVARTNALSPDIVAITGDLVDGSVRRLGALVRPLSELRATHGVYFVTGNHEYYSGAESWCRELERLGIRVLRNERVEIGDHDGGLTLAGVDDFSAGRFGGDHGADLPRALEGRDPSRPVVLLAHQPRAIFEAERLGVSLQLSGHTHGGQIWPWKYLVRLQQRIFLSNTIRPVCIARATRSAIGGARR
jgi:predicted MPP superfamily phosphohydrolase